MDQSIAVAIVAIFAVITWTVIKAINHKELYQCSNVNPLFYYVAGYDLGKSPKPYWVKGRLYGVYVIGKPDIVFRHRILPIYIVVDVKSRRLSQRGESVYERVQMETYIALMSSVFTFVRGKLCYQNEVIDVKQPGRELALIKSSIKGLKQIKGM